MKKKNRIRQRPSSVFVIAALAAATMLAAAPSLARADTFGVQLGGGFGEHDVNKLDLGLVWDPGINWWEMGGWHFSLVGEAHVDYWHPGNGTSRHDVYAFGVQPMVRFIKSAGAVRPFIEAGAGVRGLSRVTIKDGYSMGTAFQFTEIVGVGAQFGGHQQYQAGFRFQHVSNAGIKEPNPGINFSQLYLQYNF
jgi:lipid A 3-O-deacylase